MRPSEKKGTVRLQRFIEYTSSGKETNISRDVTLDEDIDFNKYRKSHMDEDIKGARGSKNCNGK